MKKILLATTVLTMSAGFAAADVKVSGSASMGIANDGDATVVGLPDLAKHHHGDNADGHARDQ